MSLYEKMSILFMFKSTLTTICIILPIIFTISALIDILKNKIGYSKPIKKMIISFLVLVITISFNYFKLFSNIEIVNLYHNASINNLVETNKEYISFVPVVMDPIYIENPYKLDIESLKSKVEKIIKNYDVGLSFYNVNSLQDFSINGDKKYFAASVSKLVVVLNLYDYAFKNNIDLSSEKIKYISSDYQGGSGILQGISNLKNRTFSLSYLASIAITESDNIAKNMIQRYMKKRISTTSYYEGLVDDEVVKDNNYLMSPNWASLIMKKIYYNEDKNPLYEKLIIDMKNTSAHSKIAQTIDFDKVAHKVGCMYLNGYLYSNDAAVIYSDSNYILTVFTKSKKTDVEMSALIGRISKLIYDEIATSQKS